VGADVPAGASRPGGAQPGAAGASVSAVTGGSAGAGGADAGVRLRLFVAVPPDPAALADLDRAVAAVRDRPGAPRWIPVDRWHLTLVFLGEVAGSRVDRLAEAVGAAVEQAPAAWLRFTGAGAFPARGAPRVLWAGVSDAGPPSGAPTNPARGGSARAGRAYGGPDRRVSDGGAGDGGGMDGGAGDGGGVERLARLARAIARAARAAGVDVERRPYRPHLTLGRWRPGEPADRGLVDALGPYSGPPFRTDHVALLRSHLGPRPRYVTLATWPLRG